MAVIQGERLDIPSEDGLSSTTACTILESIGNFEAGKKQPIAAELAVRLWLRSLALSGSYYADFEGSLWRHFSQDVSPESQLYTLTTSTRISANVEGLYSKYLPEMFVASRRTRYDFYQSMLIEAGLKMELRDADFGERAL